KVSIGYLRRSTRASSSRVASAYRRFALSCARVLALGVPDMLYAALSARSATFATHSISSSNSFSDSVMVMLGGGLSLTIRCLRIESLRSEITLSFGNVNAGWVIPVLSQRDDRGGGF